MGKPSVQRIPTEQKTVSEPWSEQQPYLKEIFGEAQNLYKSPPGLQFFPGQTYAGFAPETETALNLSKERALAGSPLAQTGKDEIQKTASGAYLDPSTNPHLKSVIESTKAHVLPGIDSRFIQAGRTKSGLHGRAVGEGLGSAVGNLMFNQYGQERGRQMQAASQAPVMAQSDYYDIGQLGQVGGAKEAQEQKGLEEAKARHDFNQYAPYDELARYMQMIQGQYGGTKTSTGEQIIQGSNPWSTGVGAGLSLAGILGKAGVFSDRRVKKDVTKVGKTDDGLPIYTYRYKGTDGPKLMGVMAQDVAKIKPEAVFDVDGVLGVDYERVA